MLTPSAELALGGDDAPVQLGIRPQQLRLGAHSTAHCALDGIVELAEISGSDTYLHVRQGETVLVAQIQGVHPLPLGSRCTLHVDPAGVYGFAADGQPAVCAGVLMARIEFIDIAHSLCARVQMRRKQPGPFSR